VSRLTDLMARVDRTTVAAILGVAAIVAIVGWFMIRTERWDSFAMAECASLYRGAGSATDTLRIDRQSLLQRSGTNPSPPTCGTLRLAYPEKVVPR